MVRGSGVLGILAGWLMLTSCSTPVPENPEDICAIFKENHDWYEAAKTMNERWGTPAQVPMAIIYQESHFKHDARQPMRYFLGFIPTGRVSSAYGYSQAQDGTWQDYQHETGHSGARRDDFADAIDFVGWYVYKTQQINSVSKWDAYNQYLNYHEGWGGYQRGSYQKKDWLLRVAQQVQERSSRYRAQFQSCKDELNHGWLYRLLFG